MIKKYTANYIWIATMYYFFWQGGAMVLASTNPVSQVFKIVFNDETREELNQHKNEKANNEFTVFFYG